MYSPKLLCHLRWLFEVAGRGADRLSEAPTHPHTIVLFKKATYLWLLFVLLLLLPAAPHFWGPEAYVLALPADSSPVGSALTVMNHPAMVPYWPAFLIGQFAALLLGLSGHCPRLAAIAVFFFTKNLQARGWVVMNGGNNLVELMLLYQIFMAPSTGASRRGTLGTLNNVVTNVAFLAARCQLAVVYLVSGLAKLEGALWPRGVALYYVLNTDEYTHPWGRTLASSDLLVALGTYGTVAFMLAFPWLVWFRKARVALLPVGALLHLNIAFLMGLVDFGTVMLACYTVFFADRWSKAVLRAVWPTGVVLVEAPRSAGEQALYALLRALDWRGALQVTPRDEAPPGLALQGPSAQRALLARLPLALPLVGLYAALDYVGLGRTLARLVPLPSECRVVRGLLPRAT